MMKKVFRQKKFWFIAGVLILFFVLSLEPAPGRITYGVSFSRFHSDELNLDWRQTYLALLNDLGVRNFRFSAHWSLTEPENNKFNFSELDYQMDQARAKNASVILAVGRRLPGWPECHEPEWALNLSKTEKQKEILEYVEKVVTRYKNYPNILYWQVENESFLTFFSRSACGELDKDFLDRETALVKSLDPAREILLTDSGEFGTWLSAYHRSDVFGTSLYLYIWNRRLGPIRYPITPAFFKIKHNLVRLFLEDKPAMIIELSSEPWLLAPITHTPLEVQFERMGLDKFNNMIDFSSKTGFDRIYLWGAEWWYWLKLNGHPEHWNRAQELFAN